MKNQATFTTRRGGMATTRQSSSAAWMRNHNTVRHAGTRNLGPISNGVIIGMLVLTMGLIYVATGTKATSYDYEISAVESEISELTARKEDLAVEKARATSVAAVKTSEVASAMETAHVTGYAD